MAVENLLEELGFQDYTVRIGTVILSGEQVDADSLEQLGIKLLNLGFELLDDEKSKLIEAIKNRVASKIHHGTLTDYQLNWSSLITEEIPYDYKYLSQLFSSIEGILCSTSFFKRLKRLKS